MSKPFLSTRKTLYVENPAIETAIHLDPSD